MTTHTEARDALVAHLHPLWRAAQPAVPIYYEDTRAISLDQAGSHFIKVAINFTDALRQGVDAVPITRHFGELSVLVFSKEGGGARKVLALADTLCYLLDYRVVGGVTLEMSVVGRKQARDGWLSTEVVTAFSFWA